jgi:hypothetical protein
MNVSSVTSGEEGSPTPIWRVVRISVKGVWGVVLGGAWLFAVVSVAWLGVVLAATDWRDPDDVCSLLSSTDGGAITHFAWGLAYRGYGGCVLAVTEAVTLLAALWLSTRSADLPRRIGLGLLLGWSAMWLVGGFCVCPAGDVDAFISAFTVLPFLLTAGRTALCWIRRSAPATAVAQL